MPIGHRVALGHRFAIQSPAHIIGHSAHRVAHEEIILARRAAHVFDEVTAAIHAQCHGILEGDDRRSWHLLRGVATGARGTHVRHVRLWIDLRVKVNHRAMHGIHHERVRRRPARRAGVVSASCMIMIAPGAVIVAAIGIQRLHGRAIRLHIAIHRIAIQRPGDGFVIPQHRDQMHRINVVVIIIRQPAVTAINVQLADVIAELPRVVSRIENRHAIRPQRHRPAQEVPIQRDRRCRRHGHQRQLPHIWLPKAQRARVVRPIRRPDEIRNWHRHLLLPGRDPHHEIRLPCTIRDAIALDVKVVRVIVKPQLRLERQKRSRHQLPIAWSCQRRALSEHSEVRHHRSHLHRVRHHWLRYWFVVRLRQSHPLGHKLIRDVLSQHLLVHRQPAGIGGMSV